MNITEEKTIGQIVADDYRTAAVFEKFGVDFCCKGNRTISEVCEKNNLSHEKLLTDLNKVTLEKESSNSDYKSWPLDLLADYIEKKHHRYVAEKIPVIQQYLKKLSSVHGKQHPELFEIYDLFNQSAGDLTAHMKKEEFILFPFVRKMVEAEVSGTPLSAPHFGTVENPVQMMMHEHDAEGERFRKIAELSNNYTPPADGCNTYRVTLALIKEFEDDLHLHIHLENNILFPQAIDMEKRLNG
ncbi:iron-sulfur cluster repair di-iron protein [Cytophagaceae bacterium ABcell3]|nr:iron-sulfur cluster repair di-iron protein [Cytophagaceae bacterium ABcell3]